MDDTDRERLARALERSNVAASIRDLVEVDEPSRFDYLRADFLLASDWLAEHDAEVYESGYRSALAAHEIEDCR